MNTNMRLWEFEMKKFLLIWLSALILSASIVNASSVVKLSIADQQLLYPLPSGYCNITDDVTGIFLNEFLAPQTKKLGLPKPQLFIAPCGGDNSSGYPWLWVGLAKNNPIMSQNAANKFLAKLIDNEKALEAINKKVKASNKNTIETLAGWDSDLDFSKQKIVWADENSFLVGQHINGQVEGMKIEEVNLTSTTIVGEVIVFTYAYNLIDSQPTEKDMSAMLINNAIKLKRLNQ